MRILAIGDIHGCSTAFDTLLAEVAPQPDDLIITLGDYVDRGPDSRGVIEHLLRLHQTQQVVSLRGNHDFMMLEARKGSAWGEGWLEFGGKETLQSYGSDGRPGTLHDVPSAHWDFLENVCGDFFETDHHFFVHANVYPDRPLKEQPTSMLYWEKLLAGEHNQPHVSGKIMICGHTAQHSGKPLNFGHAVCIDTWAYGQGWLTCLDVENRLYWQANQRGESRMANLDRFGRR